MNHSDTLLSIAEIAVALAGFASIISIFGRRQSEDSRAVEGRRLQSMLEVALRNAAFALVPLPFLESAASDAMLWRFMSGLYLSVTLLHGTLALRRRPGVFDQSWLSSATLGLLAVSLLVCLLNVVGLGGESAFSLYLASLLLGLVAAGLLFSSVAASVFSPREP